MMDAYSSYLGLDDHDLDPFLDDFSVDFESVYVGQTNKANFTGELISLDLHYCPYVFNVVYYFLINQ
jgi:hypothetical protein